MAQGIDRVNMQLGTSFPFSAWQPIPNANHPAAVHGG
jgi:hypothetical protein